MRKKDSAYFVWISSVYSDIGFYCVWPFILWEMKIGIFVIIPDEWIVCIYGVFIYSNFDMSYQNAIKYMISPAIWYSRLQL